MKKQDNGCRMLTLRQTARFLKKNDNYIILTHASPDGDTLGSAYALYYGLKECGKIASVICPDVIPAKYGYFVSETDHVCDDGNAVIIAVDVADKRLLGSLCENFGDRVTLNIDHHVSNTRYAKNLYLDADAAATAESIFELLTLMKVNINDTTAQALYTGLSTDTGCFKYGNVTAKTHLIAAQLETVIDGFRGEISQQPPMYSALKKNGVRLYELARRGEETDIPFRDVTVHSIKIISPLDSNGEFEFEAYVSKGTYIRSLVRDIGKKCGCGAALTALRRTETAGFKAESCVAIDNLNPENLSDFLLSEETAVGHLPAVYVTERQALRFINGGELSFDRLSLKNTADGALFRVKFNGMLLGIGICNAEKHQLAVKCVLITPGEFAAEKEMRGL